MKEHYFTVKAEVVDGKATFSLVNDMVVDPDRPVWDDEAGEWQRVTGANEADDRRLTDDLNSRLS